MSHGQIIHYINPLIDSTYHTECHEQQEKC